ncbi:ISKra4 family transposase [Trebonia kvetii]|uniref:ISKra4 family transposase n=1 Tax=Trebonia kvetii TaxID=2480626 RepID=A0A6P2C510_9ACTN|nr:ISKra4 family transposase [Trebonia kvetii]TVZ06338.1 ISKra4 family transposase [Trebonia kvetii]
MIRAGMLKVGAGMLGELLSADRGHRGPRVPCGNGHRAEFISYREKVIDTVLGPVTLNRAWYHCAECKHGLAPRDAELGVAGASLSPGLTAMNDKAAAAGPFAGAAAMLEDLAGIRLTVKRTERAAEASGAAHAARDRERAALTAARKLVPLPLRPAPDMLYGVIDGTGVPMTARETAGREGRGEDGRARTREVKLAVFFNQSELSDEGYPVRDRASSSYIASFETASAFAGLVKAEGIRRGADHVRQLTFIGDGAAWIWNLVTGTFPAATQIVDLYHAREHLHSLARSLEFMLLDHYGEWLEARLEDLDYGYIDGIEAAVREFPLEGTKKTEADKELGYFLNNAPRMRYKWFRQCGLFVGSGVVEAGCKTIVGQRLKQAGMHWTTSGADSIITLRCREASSKWEAICNTPDTQTRTA